MLIFTFWNLVLAILISSTISVGSTTYKHELEGQVIVCYTWDKAAILHQIANIRFIKQFIVLRARYDTYSRDYGAFEETKVKWAIGDNFKTPIGICSCWKGNRTHCCYQNVQNIVDEGLWMFIEKESSCKNFGTYGTFADSRESM